MNFYLSLSIMGVLCFLVLLSLSSGNQGVLYRSLLISRLRLSSGARMSDSVTVSLTPGDFWRFPCSKACRQFDWCNLWCPDFSFSTSTTVTCLLFQMYVVSGYQETNTADAIDCYTTNVKDYAIGASIEATPVIASKPNRVKYNIIDGIYDFSIMDQCLYTGHHFNPYFKLDFGSPKPVRRVMFLLQPNSFVQYNYNIKVLVGTEDYPEADFPSYQLFGYFPGPSSPNQEVSFSYIDPVLARYVVVQRMSHSSCNPDGSTMDEICNLQICHIEIN